ncbi:hypothetical protein [Amycolatopsis sp. SID8362]|uniref:hypothetical protein n=1 Tax=Amycolatopsis sp. SID8362 TaxID=2690346 RepID=UPI00136EB82C|nr:hypothetical protein [Amycolatopsis sp. SID8362]NBH12290.1 hypothetical protein [Amycolatopsis sp. SID8362]NED48982.1 hypothetical protein [Amycolatopsis sp. SID8362]
MSPAALVRGFLGGGVAGAALSAFVTGIVLEEVPLFLTAFGLPIAYGALLFAAGMPRRAREAAVVPRVALARIESRRAGGTETGDVPVTLVLTVDGSPPFRVEITHHVNLADLPDIRVGDVLVVEYPPDRPWRAEVVAHPTAEWRRRAEEAVIEPAPQSAVVGPPPEGCAFSVVAFAGLLLGAAVVLGLFRVELFSPAEEQPESTTTEVTTTTETFSFHITVGGPGGTTTFVLPPR